MDLEKFRNKIKEKSQNLFVTIQDPDSNKQIKYSIHNETTMWRAQTLFSKEPVTINWIKKFSDDSIFYDIGANVGMYSIFAATIKDIKVFSFEPESNNFQILMENIIINNLNNKITPFPLSISNKTELTTLFLNKFSKGESHHMIKKSLDHNLKEKKINFKQGTFSTSLNELVYKWGLPIPNYLKIDVDGIEFKIIEQSDEILKNEKLKSILIEINSKRKEDLTIIDKLKKYSFTFDQLQVDIAMRKSGSHLGYAEYLFYKK